MSLELENDEWTSWIWAVKVTWLAKNFLQKNRKERAFFYQHIRYSFEFNWVVQTSAIKRNHFNIGNYPSIWNKWHLQQRNILDLKKSNLSSGLKLCRTSITWVIYWLRLKSREKGTISVKQMRASSCTNKYNNNYKPAHYQGYFPELFSILKR